MPPYETETFPVNAPVEVLPTEQELRKAEAKRLRERLKWLKALEKAEKVVVVAKWWLNHN